MQQHWSFESTLQGLDAAFGHIVGPAHVYNSILLFVKYCILWIRCSEGRLLGLATEIRICRDSYGCLVQASISACWFNRCLRNRLRFSYPAKREHIFSSIVQCALEVWRVRRMRSIMRTVGWKSRRETVCTTVSFYPVHGTE